MKHRLIAVLVVLAACGGDDRPRSPGKGAAGAKPRSAAGDAPLGLDLRLSDGTQGAPAYDRGKLAQATRLGDAEVEALLARATQLPVAADDRKAFALRPASQPAPRAGDTVRDSFPPPPSSLLPPAASEAGKALEVLRWMPEGEVKVAPELSVTFSQPMVAVTSQDDAAAIQPVKLTPQPKGRWRWIGTRTIVFDPEVRFPQSTTYKVEVPAGTRSASGGTLAKAHTFSFETPAPQLKVSYPGGGPQRLDVPVFLQFDQKIDRQAVLSAIKVTAPASRPASGGDPWRAPSASTQQVALRMLDAAEFAKHRGLKALVDAAGAAGLDGTYLAFRPVTKLPPDATITVEIPAGTPSAEGPNRTRQAQSFSFQTFPPLRREEANCGYNDCRPGMSLTFRFNNPIDASAFRAQLVTVSPQLDGMKVMASDRFVTVIGMTKARTDYQVTIAAGLTDEFGQTLGKPTSETFHVGDARPTFFGPSGLVVLDPAAPRRTLDFFSTNYDALKVRVYKVAPSDLAAYGRYVRERWNRDKPPPVPGVQVVDELVKTRSAPNELVETSVDLAPALSADGFGHAIVIAQPHPWPNAYEPPTMVAWVQATRLAVDAHVDGDNLLAFVTELDGGKPASGVQLELAPHGLLATSDAQGLATIPLGPMKNGTYYLSARRGGDVAFVSEDTGYFDDYGSWFRKQAQRNLAWYVVDDRRLYKPGEQVSLKGWLRVVDQGKQGDVEDLAGAVTSVAYQVTDSRGNELAKGTAPVSPVGGWDATFALPKTPNLGAAYVNLTASGAMSGAYAHEIQIEEFRRPEFEVSASAGAGPFVIGGGGDVTVAAKYFAGGALPGAEVTWSVSSAKTSFTPPNRDDFVFGEWVPWWSYRGWSEDDDDDDDRARGDRAPTSYTHIARTDAMGEHVLHLDFLSARPSVPFTVTASASVMDVNRQAWTASSSLTVHPSSLYAGIKTRRAFVEQGAPFEVDVIAVDLDGKAVPGARLELRAARLDWEFEQGRYRTKEVDPQTCRVVAKVDAVPCRFSTRTGGTYQLVATVVDDKGRENLTKLTYWVAGGASRPPARDVEQEVVQLIPDRKEYAPGTTAELLVQAPFYPAEGLVTWRRSGIVKTERISLSGPTASLRVPIVDAMTPNLHVQVDLVGMAARTSDKGAPDPTLPKRPAYAVGTIELAIPPKHRTLQVTASPAAARLGPAEKTSIAIEVKDASGKPLADAEAAVIVVDEAILALTGYRHPEPIGAFHPTRETGTSDHYARAYVKLARPEETLELQGTGPGGGGIGPRGGGGMPMPAEAAPAPSAAGAMESAAAPAPRKMAMASREVADTSDVSGERARNAGVLGQTAPTAGLNAPVAVRSNFNPLAAFSPSVKTGPDGKATVQVTVPDNLTRYRVIAIAAYGARQFGKGESAITARLPLMVRPSPPRFLNFGDTFRLPVVVQNQTDAPMTVRVAARASNARFTEGAGREVAVPANDRVEIQLPAAAEEAGTARFQIVGAAGAASDAANLELPVWTPATTEAFATYGVIDAGAVAQPVALPGKVWPQFGGLEVTTASTNLQALTDAVIYLVRYPFECAEQRSSRILAIAALRDVLTAFHTRELPSVDAMTTSVDRDLERLSQMQNYDGGFAFWERGHPSEPYLSVFVAQALVKARAKQFAIQEAMIQRARGYLEDIESHYPAWWPEDVKTSVSAYALYVRKQMNDLDVAKARALLASRGGPDKLPMEANGWLLATLAGNADAAAERQQILRHALNRVSETAGAANFTTRYDDGAYLLLASERRVDAIMLEALIQEQRSSDLIPKLVTGLMAHRKRGRWLSTQENAFVLMALDLYFRTYERVTPDFVARVWLGADYAGEHAFRGRTTEQHQIDIAMTEVAARDKQSLTIQKDGEGRLYYRIGMKYAPEDLRVAPADYGFVVQRRYEAIDKPDDVTRDQAGVWHIKAGARVRVKLDLVNENRRYHVALVDPLPAGLEPMNPALAATGPLPAVDPRARGAGEDRYWWWYGPWYEHQNMRDERVEAFASLLWEGSHAYEYVARATTPGSFVVPPPKAEEMYMPETFGRGASDRVIVE